MAAISPYPDASLPASPCLEGERELIFGFCRSAMMGMKTLTKLSQPACRHPWPPPSITLHPAPIGNPSLAGAHSILLMPCRHTAKSPFLPPQPPACPRIQQKSHFQVKKKILSSQTFPPPIAGLCSEGDFGCYGATACAEHKRQSKDALCLEDVTANGNASLDLFGCVLVWG